MKHTYFENVLKKTLFFFCIMFSLGVFAQGEIIKGTVTSSEGMTLPGVNIIQKGTGNGAVTDFDGNYSIKLGQGSKTLVFSYIGYTAKEVVTDGKTIVNVKLQEDLENLDEVVIVGYGAIKKSDLTGSVSSLDGKELEDQVFPSVTQSLQGRVSGVQITSNSGEPGGGISIQIRGTNSILGDNQPLYVINGIPIRLEGKLKETGIG